MRHWKDNIFATPLRFRLDVAIKGIIVDMVAKTPPENNQERIEMRTNPHAQAIDRICLPRRLVPRRPSACLKKMFAAVYETNVPRFAVGDILTIESSATKHNYLTILGIDPSGDIEAMAYDGRPHLFYTSINDLTCLRIVRVDFMGPRDVADYREALKLDPWQAEIVEVAA